MLKLLEQAEELCLKLCGKSGMRAAKLMVRAQMRYDRRMWKAINEVV